MRGASTHWITGRNCNTALSSFIVHNKRSTGAEKRISHTSHLPSFLNPHPLASLSPRSPNRHLLAIPRPQPLSLPAIHPSHTIPSHPFNYLLHSDSTPFTSNITILALFINPLAPLALFYLQSLASPSLPSTTAPWRPSAPLSLAPARSILEESETGRSGPFGTARHPSTLSLAFIVSRQDTRAAGGVIHRPPSSRQRL